MTDDDQERYRQIIGEQKHFLAYKYRWSNEEILWLSKEERSNWVQILNRQLEEEDAALNNAK